MVEKLKPSEAFNLVFNEYPDVVTIEDICSMLCIGKSKAYELVHTGVLKSIPCGKNFKVPKIFIIDFVLNESISQSELKKGVIIWMDV